MKDTPKSYPTPLEMVKHYQQVTQQEADPNLYENLISEEYDEWFDEGEVEHGLAFKDTPYSPEAELKELADLVYVIYGYAAARGWDLDEALYLVHDNNLARMKQDDGTILRREDGKIIRNKNVPPPKLRDLV